MQLANVLCYIIWTITVAVTCAEADDANTNELQKSQHENGISKREATIIIDHYPVDKVFQKPKIIHKRISQSQRYVPPTSQYRSTRPRYKSHKPLTVNRKPGKKYRNHKPKHLSSKYLPPSRKQKKRNPKPRYGPPSNSNPSRPKPGFGQVIKMSHYTHPNADNTGFGEPPTNYANEYQPFKQSYGEPPVDSYGAPLKLSMDTQVHPSAPQSFHETKNHFEEQDHKKQAYPPWAHSQDASFASSKRKPSFSKPEPEMFGTPLPQDYNDDFDEVQLHKENTKKFSKKKKPQYITDNTKAVNRPWRANKKPHEAEIIVGGQYAEPPPRYAARFQPSAPMFEDDEESFAPYHQDFVSNGFRSPAANSPYVNYKNSNLAFSPQNLNDAFSIVDK